MFEYNQDLADIKLLLKDMPKVIAALPPRSDRLPIASPAPRAFVMPALPALPMSPSVMPSQPPAPRAWLMPALPTLPAVTPRQSPVPSAPIAVSNRASISGVLPSQSMKFSATSLADFGSDLGEAVGQFKETVAVFADNVKAMKEAINGLDTRPGPTASGGFNPGGHKPLVIGNAAGSHPPAKTSPAKTGGLSEAIGSLLARAVAAAI
jgi:hypothetical protein